VHRIIEILILRKQGRDVYDGTCATSHPGQSQQQQSRQKWRLQSQRENILVLLLFLFFTTSTSTYQRQKARDGFIRSGDKLFQGDAAVIRQSRDVFFNNGNGGCILALEVDLILPQKHL